MPSQSQQPVYCIILERHAAHHTALGKYAPGGHDQASVPAAGDAAPTLSWFSEPSNPGVPVSVPA